MVKQIIQLGDPRLFQKSEPVTPEELDSPTIQNLIQDLIDTCKFHEEGTAGLSAVQIGVLKRVFVARRIDLEEEQKEKNKEEIVWEVMINPEVEILDATPHMIWEGCMSVGEGADRLFGPVSRPVKVKVTYLDAKGKQRELVGEKEMSHIIQHEQDHLDGKLFLRYVTNPQNIWKNDELEEYLDKHEAFPPAL